MVPYAHQSLDIANIVLNDQAAPCPGQGLPDYRLINHALFVPDSDLQNDILVVNLSDLVLIRGLPPADLSLHLKPESISSSPLYRDVVVCERGQPRLLSQQFSRHTLRPHSQLSQQLPQDHE